MKESIANLAHPVISHGLRLQERLWAGEQPNFDREQVVLKNLLLTDYEARRWNDFGGDDRRKPDNELARHKDNSRRDDDQFLGVRYALVCWLDELFTRESSWGARWNERKLEVELYGSNDRAWKFWRQAELAQARPGSDALEVFYLCVMLGFRGEKRGQADALRKWVAAAKLRLGKVRQLDWPYAAELDPPTRVPPLRGRERLKRMALTGWVTLLLLTPVVAFLLAHKLGQ